ncbi:MAG TPA: rhomboid family intramembrane serine protease [Chitinophagales bacterium]|nr:rhomboid family intramembrane serine protease [Chitinophagales bacterium]
MAQPEQDIQRKKIFVSIYISALLVASMGLVHLLQIALGTHWYAWSIEPREITGLRGILFAPMLHSDWEHYVSNAVAMLVLFAVTIFFYRLVAYRVLVWVWLLDGIGVWLLGRDSFHLGASGLVYGLAAFLLFSGMLRKNRSLTAISMFVVVGYGGLIWGMMPVLDHISWEAHLFGFLAGIALSVVYRTQGPQNDPLPEWYHEEDSDDDAATNPFEPPQLPPSSDPLFPQAPVMTPRVTPVAPTPDDEHNQDGNANDDEQPRIRITYNYRKK